MSILATTSLLKNNHDITSQVLNYPIGNTVFVLRIPKEYEGTYLGRINQKYAGRVSGMQDECVSILDVLEIENIPSEFVVCSIKKSNEKHGKYDVMINPKYFEIDKNTALKETILSLVEKVDNDIKRSIAKDYMNIESLSKEIFPGYMSLFSMFHIDSDEFIEEINKRKESKIGNIRK